MDAIVDGLALLWPGSSADDIVRRQLALLLLEDPDNRLRVAHLEPLLHLRVSPRAACSSGRLQALLTDPINTRIFPVDFQDSKVADWRSRVVYLDRQQLSQEVAAAKQQQHQGYSAAALCAGRTGREPSGNSTGSISNFSADTDAPAREELSPSGICQSQQQELQQGGYISIVAQEHASSVGQQPLMLDSIFSASPIMTHGNHSHVVDKSSSGGAKTAADTHAGAMAGLSNSYGMAVGSAGAADPRPPSISLFGSSFEVPHAIASCWAPSSSFDSGTSSDLARATRGRAAVAGKRNAESLDVHEAGGGSSTASGSSSRSVSATTRVVGASTASRLRQASNNHAADAADLADAAAGEQLSAVCSSGALSGLDVATPMSCRNGGVSGSPANSSSCEDDVEYNEAQLVFGLPGCAAGPATSNVSATAVDSGGNGGTEAAVASASAATPRDRDGPSVEDALLEATTPLHGVDWSKVAALHHQQQQQLMQQQVLQQQQQQQLSSSWQQHGLHAGHQALLFGLDDLHDDLQLSSAVGGHALSAASLSAAAAAAAAASGALTARRLMMDQAADTLSQTGNSSLFSSSIGVPGARLGTATGSLPLNVNSNCISAAGLQDLLLSAGSFERDNSNLAVYGAGAVGLGVNGMGLGARQPLGATAAGATAAELAESVLLDAEGGLTASSLHHQLPAYAGQLASSSYGSIGVLSDRSSSGCWGTSPAIHGFGLQQQQQRPQHLKSAEVAGDIRLRSDQLKEPNNKASNAAAAAKTEANATGEKPAGVPTLGQAPRLTGWASIAAKEPKASPATPKAVAAGREGLSSGNMKQPTAVGAQGGNGTVGGGKAADASKGLHKLPARVRSEVHALVGQYAGVLKAEDFDDGVVHQLNAKRSEDEAVAAVRHIAHYDLANIQHMAAYLNHLVKHYNHNAAAAAAAASDNGSLAGAGPGAASGPTAAMTTSSGAAARPGAAGTAQGGGLGGTSASRTSGSTAPAVAGAGGNLGAFGGQIRLASVPVSTKAMLQKLPLKVFRQLEQLVAGCAYLEWRHFDAGVVKVLAQLSKLCEADVFEELELLAATDLSNVEYMPAYLNKRLNNKLWSRRKATGDVPNA